MGNGEREQPSGLPQRGDRVGARPGTIAASVGRARGAARAPSPPVREGRIDARLDGRYSRNLGSACGGDASGGPNAPWVSGSESSRSTGPTCVVAGVAADCAGSVAPGAVPHVPGPVLVAPVPVLGSVLGTDVGGASGGRAGTDTDVERSNRPGSAIAR